MSCLASATYQIEGGTRSYGSPCGFDFYSTRSTKIGRFFSPRYPQNYPPNSNCQYIFYGLPGELVRVTFGHIQLVTTLGRWAYCDVVVRGGRVSWRNWTVHAGLVDQLLDTWDGAEIFAGRADTAFDKADKFVTGNGECNGYSSSSMVHQALLICCHTSDSNPSFWLVEKWLVFSLLQ